MTDARTLTTEEIDALLRRLDGGTSPDPAFIAWSHSDLVARVQARRAANTTRLGRLRRDLRLAATPAIDPGSARTVRMAAMVALVVLALVAGAVIVGALNRHPLAGNGLVVVSFKGQLEAVDPVDGSSRPILGAGEQAEGVSRSPDGRHLTFWTRDGVRSRLFAVGVDGRGRRELAGDLSMTWNDSIDTWSSDSRSIATEVTMDGQTR